MSLIYLKKRREIEGIYKKLELLRSDMKTMMVFGNEQFTLGNINLLEMEETKLINRLLRLKSLM
jgi:hypothetical protein